MIKKLCKWIRIAAAIVAIIGFIFTYVNTIVENAKLENRVAELESKVQELQSELEGIRAAYRNLLATLITEGKVGIKEIKPFLSKEEVQKVEGQVSKFALSLPVNIDVYFFPSGWMGDGEYGERYITFTRSAEYIKITYIPGPKGWAGIYWQFPDGNWGKQPGRNLSGAQRLTFWVKGETGNEIVEFKTGGIRGQKYEDSYEKSLGRIKLFQSWKQYEIDLADQDLSSVIGAFAWIASKDANPRGVTFYLKDIYFEK